MISQYEVDNDCGLPRTPPQGAVSSPDRRPVFITDDERDRMFDEDMQDMGESHPGHPDNFGNQ